MKFFKSAALPLILGGFFAGFANGLLGAGGGIIIVYILSRLIGARDGCDGRDAFANALCVMLPLSVVSCIIYAIRGDIKLSGFGAFILPAIVGGVIGGYLLNRINTVLLKRLFAVLVVVSGILLIVR